MGPAGGWRCVEAVADRVGEEACRVVGDPSQGRIHSRGTPFSTRRLRPSKRPPRARAGNPSTTRPDPRATAGRRRFRQGTMARAEHTAFAAAAAQVDPTTEVDVWLSTFPFYTAEAQGPYDLVSIGRFELEEGGVIPDLQLAVATFGTLAEDKNNAILIPTWFSARTRRGRRPTSGQGEPWTPNAISSSSSIRSATGSRPPTQRRRPEHRDVEVPARADRRRRARPGAAAA